MPQDKPRLVRTETAKQQKIDGKIAPGRPWRVSWCYARLPELAGTGGPAARGPYPEDRFLAKRCKTRSELLENLGFLWLREMVSREAPRFGLAKSRPSKPLETSGGV